MSLNSRYETQVIRFMGNTTRKVQDFTRKVAFHLMDRTIMRTPVDTGRARASWNIVKGNVPDLTFQPKSFYNPSGFMAIAQQKQSRMGLGYTYMITNNLHYIVGLENGSSRQAPQGMVKLAIADVMARARLNLL